MIIDRCRLRAYKLPLKCVWQTNRGAIQQRAGWLVELTTDMGLQGYGDCAPLPSSGTETTPLARTWLAEQLPLLQNLSPIDALEQLPKPTGRPAARHAIETALLDLISQARQLSLRKWLSPTAVDEIEVNGSGGTLDEHVLNRTAQLLSQGYRIIKLKVGVYGVGQELDQLQRLCGQLAGSLRLRLDANGAWSAAQARQFLDQLAGYPIESLEEPLNIPDLHTLSALQHATDISLALDESLPRFPLETLFEHPPVRRLIIKPSVLGGLLPAKQIAESASRAGMEAVVTSTLESSVGIRAAAQLAMAIDPTERPVAHGLATGNWFITDVAEAVDIEQGRLRLANTAGLGAQLTSEFIHSSPMG